MAGRKVLLVDDDPRFLRLATLRLRQTELVIFPASSWAEASAFLAKQPDLVLLDVHMAVHQGDEICALLKQADATLPVLLISSEDEDDLRRRAEEVGADGYLSKSTSTAEVLRVVNEQLQRAPRGASGAPPG